MKVVSIIVPENAIAASIFDPQYMFSAVNEFFMSDGNLQFFKIQLVGIEKEIKLNGGFATIRADLLLDDVERSDLIIIPAISKDIKAAIESNRRYIPWIKKLHEGGSEVASLCLGAFLLASTGLLNGRSCSTHWLHAKEFREMFPDVKLEDDKIITDQNGIYSSGGATSYWNLLLYLVEKYTGREMAVRASKYFLLNFDRDSQQHFNVFMGQKDHGDELILSIQDYIEQSYNNKLTVNKICNKFGIGRRTFERRFKKATSNTIAEYIQRVKVESAKKQLETGSKTVNEVMYDVGYIDTKAFRSVFRKIAGMTPAEYRNKFRY